MSSGVLVRDALPRDRGLRALLYAGVLLRLALFVPLYPTNNDDHFGVIQYILREHALPPSDVLSQAYHPPLYYLLAAPFAALGGVRGAEVLSLLFSLANLWLLARFLDCTELVARTGTRRHALALAAFLPQFVVFGLFVTNDTLSYLVGTGFLLVAFAYVERPSGRRLTAVGAMTGIGLLTKGTFLAFVPVAVVLVLAVGWRRRLPLGRVIAHAAFCLALGLTLGSYKFVENYERLGRPIVHNLELPGHELFGQRGTIRGAGSFVAFDLPRLVVAPYDQRHVRHSVPMLLYATTWWSYIRDSNFTRTRQPGWRIVASLLCLAGIVPTGLGVIGLARLGARWRDVANVPSLAEREYVELGRRITAAGTLVATLGIVIAAGVKYDVWSCFQGRLLFPAILGALLLFAAGFDGVVLRWPASTRWLHRAMYAAYAVFAAYYVVEGAGAMGL
ncbi:MAG TPA: glycosyltransferase family 39 protein [Gemmatimonadaceae bacterium]|nr:glycosyltransferase family 39 protein [Gemmatimonadaceae bacterium]